MTESQHYFGKYEIIDTLGQGAYATVYLAYDTTKDLYTITKKDDKKICDQPDKKIYDLSEDTVAIKRYNKQNFNIKKFDIEKYVLNNSILCKNIIKPIEFVNNSIIMPCYPHTLSKFIKTIYLKHAQNKYSAIISDVYMNKQFNILLYKIIYDIVIALIHCKDNLNIVHCDIKPSNIMIDDSKNKNFHYDKFHEFESILIDFSISKKKGYSIENYFQTRWYRAPEIILGSYECDYTSDIWALGCIILEMIINNVAFVGKNEKDQYEIYTQKLGLEKPIKEKQLIKEDDLPLDKHLHDNQSNNASIFLHEQYVKGNMISFEKFKATFPNNLVIIDDTLYELAYKCLIFDLENRITYNEIKDTIINKIKLYGIQF